MAKTKPKPQLELIEPEQLPREAQDISGQIQEKLREKEEIRERRDFLSEQPMQLRIEIQKLKEEWEKRVALSSKKRLGLSEKEHLIEVAKSPDRPERLKYIEDELESVIKEINALNDSMNQIDKEIKQLGLDRKRVITAHECQQIVYLRRRIWEKIDEAQKDHEALIKHISNVQKNYRELGYVNWTHCMTAFGVPEYDVSFIGVKVKEFAKKISTITSMRR